MGDGVGWVEGEGGEEKEGWKGEGRGGERRDGREGEENEKVAYGIAHPEIVCALPDAFAARVARLWPANANALSPRDRNL